MKFDVIARQICYSKGDSEKPMQNIVYAYIASNSMLLLSKRYCNIL